MSGYAPASRPTLYFIGVTTGQSSIMRVFPLWAEQLGLGDCELRGIDFPLHAPAADYRAAVEFIRDDPLSLGALVTTHKIDLYNACHDLFDDIDEHAALMGETSCISKHNGQLICHAKDPISSGLAIDGFMPPEHFARHDAALFCIGAGGSTIAIVWHLAQQSRKANRPAEIVISNLDAPRLDHIEKIRAQLNPDIPMRLIEAKTSDRNDDILRALPAGSFVVNATGLGKDRPGSPLADPVFPEQAIAWDLNYRGDLVFLDQAHAQETARRLQIEDGWTYFIHGWTQVIAEVFHVDVPTRGRVFDKLSDIAQSVRRATTSPS